MEALNGEIECLKKQYMREMEVLRAENDRLKAQITRGPSVHDRGSIQSSARRRHKDQEGYDEPMCRDTIRSKSHDRAGAGMRAPTQGHAHGEGLRSRSGNERDSYGNSTMPYRPQAFLIGTSGTKREGSYEPHTGHASPMRP